MNAWNLKGPSADASQSADDALSVSQSADLAVDALHGVPRITVLGEVTGFRGPNARSGHCYFQIKDESAALECIVWKGTYDKRTFDLRDGLQVLFTGTFDVYKPTGKMSFKASSFALAGEGLLRQQVAQLAEKLRREGLMEPERKRRIPVFCTRIAVVTSLSGAVINDVKRTLYRRNRMVEIICVGAKVQGDGAPGELIEGLRRAAALAPDCILLVRGGGSFEDLMTFNDESLARAVASCPVPVVTGIGHEPDNSICDMVSDRRCSTPTAAAESVAPEFGELVQAIDARERRLGSSLSTSISAAAAECLAAEGRAHRAMGARLDRAHMALAALADRPCLGDPTNIVERRRFELEQTGDRLLAAGDRSQEAFARDLDRLAPRLAGTTNSLARRRHALELASSRLQARAEALLTVPAADIGRWAVALDALSPLKVLGRGYSIAYTADDHVAARASDFADGDEMRVRMVDGDVRATVRAVEPVGQQ